jgi:hypothetical protein
MYIGSIVEKLCELSDKEQSARDHYIEWPDEIYFDQPFLPDELISIYGAQVFGALTSKEQRLLGFYELVNFFSLNINFEKRMLVGLVERLYGRDKWAISPYLHHFINEENCHISYMAEFCNRFAGRIYPNEMAPGTGPGITSEERDLIFFYEALVFKEIAYQYRSLIAAHNTCYEFVRKICHLHAIREKRQIIFLRCMVEELYRSSLSDSNTEKLNRYNDHFAQFFGLVWKSYYDTCMYKDAGIDEDLRDSIAGSQNALSHRKSISANCIDYLLQIGILSERPALGIN